MDRWTAFMPEIYALGLAIFWLILSVIRPSRQSSDYRWLSLGLGLIGIWICWESSFQFGAAPAQIRFYNTYRIDLFSQGFKLLLMIGYALILNLPKNLNCR